MSGPTVDDGNMKEPINPTAVTKEVAKLGKALIAAQEENRLLKLRKICCLWDGFVNMFWAVSVDGFDMTLCSICLFIV